MNIAFFLDAKLVKKEEKYYTTGAVTEEYLQRHKVTTKDKLTVICREQEDNFTYNIKSLAEGENISFKTFSSYKKIIKNRKIIEKIIIENDFIDVKLPTVIGLFAMHYVLKHNKNHIVEMVGCPLDAYWYCGNVLGKIIAPIMYILNKHYIKKAKNVIYVTEEFLEKRYPTKGKYQYCSDADIDKCNDSILEKRLAKIKNKSKKYKVGLIGALHTNYKGHETVIKAFSKLKGKFDFEIHFLGYGSNEKWKKMAEKYGIKENIIFDGTLPHSEINKWFDDIDFYLIPSLTEGMPRALIEAMSRACPAIGTKVGGIPEILSDKMLIKKKSDKELAKLVLELIQNKKLQEKCAIENFEKAKEFEKEKLTIKRKEFYEEILREVSINEESFTSSK